MYTQSVSVFLDSGLQKRFFSLLPHANTANLPEDAPKSLQEAIDFTNNFCQGISEDTLSEFHHIRTMQNNEVYQEYKNGNETMPSIRWRYGKKVWKLSTGVTCELFGIWLLVETNTASENGNRSDLQMVNDRGYFYDTRDLTPEEKAKALQAQADEKPFLLQETPYIRLKPGTQFELHFPFDGQMRFFLNVCQPAAITPRDVDLILDLGNTRSSGLLFEHMPNNTFPVNSFVHQFKVLRLDPDPDSGSSATLDDVQAGITSSWMVFHECDHQSYVTQQQLQANSQRPTLLLSQAQNVQIQRKRKGLFGWETIVSGEVLERIPQMFMTLSPVLLGERARKEFNQVYARNMVTAGANIQQSSPKRYYWDNDIQQSDWHMLLNPWDSAYNANPATGAFLPGLQGELFRFIQHDGKLYDLEASLPPTERPDPYPLHPCYPRQCTITWFLLHVLERAYAQSQTAFSQGQNFIPHRLRKVLITYPAGWTEDEVSLYRARCEEALNIFSLTHIYHQDQKLELVQMEQSPDEAVAVQLPFLFSEIVRTPGGLAQDWFKIAGKDRGGRSSMRMLNIDIGGGTTDISVVEYSTPVQMGMTCFNQVNTELLFKDGQTTAGDDLLKKIIETCILGSLIASDEVNAETIRIRFSSVSGLSREDTILRSRVTRTCLIPLALFCLKQFGANFQFSASDAGIDVGNWDEFNRFLGAGDTPLFDKDFSYFHFDSNECNRMIREQFEQLFQNCAHYVAVFDVDMVIFSGKTSELPYFRTLAEQIFPLDSNRLVFARLFKPGNWYPFRDKDGYIQDAKTVTVIGAGLYYALSSGCIQNWTISSVPTRIHVRNEWGELHAMKERQTIFLDRNSQSSDVELLPNSIIARRRNVQSAPEAVYRFITPPDRPNIPYNVRLSRNEQAQMDDLNLTSVNGEPPSEGFSLKLYPTDCPDGFWQETGAFDL